MIDQWAFGWNQILTIAGLIITIGIAVSGFRTFGRWRREKIEERRIDIALEALSIAYESQVIFDAIRNPGSFGYESDDMPHNAGESDDDRRSRSPYYVTLKRMSNSKDFFLKVFQLQPRFMAVFGPETEKLFKELNWARVHVLVAAQMLMQHAPRGYPNEEKQRARMLSDIWAGQASIYNEKKLPEGDRVQKKLDAFKDGIVNLCRPVVDREFKANSQWPADAHRRTTDDHS